MSQKCQTDYITDNDSTQQFLTGICFLTFYMVNPYCAEDGVVNFRFNFNTACRATIGRPFLFSADFSGRAMHAPTKSKLIFYDFLLLCHPVLPFSTTPSVTDKP